MNAYSDGIMSEPLEIWLEWFKAPALKAGDRETGPWVRILQFPPEYVHVVGERHIK